MPGKIRNIDMQAAANLWGYTDVWPDAEQAAAVLRAQTILQVGLAQQTIRTAMRR